MTIDEIIAQKPHLADPLRFYQKATKFTNAVNELRIPLRSGKNAYPPEFTVRLLDLFSHVIELPEGALSPLRQALELGEIDFTRLPLREVPAFSLPYAEDDLSMILFLVSRPYFLALRESNRMDDRPWGEGKCPVCSAQPSLASETREGRLDLSCSFCRTAGYVQQSQCPVCLMADPSRLYVLTFADEEGFSIQVCDACRSYVKKVRGELLARVTPDLADLMSLPLDVVVQQRGYSRRSPNPIGMLKMSASG